MNYVVGADLSNCDYNENTGKALVALGGFGEAQFAIQVISSNVIFTAMIAFSSAVTTFKKGENSSKNHLHWRSVCTTISRAGTISTFLWIIFGYCLIYQRETKGREKNWKSADFCSRERHITSGTPLASIFAISFQTIQSVPSDWVFFDN